MINALILTSNDLRHRYLVKKVSEYFNVKAVLIEEKGDYYSNQKRDSLLVKEHFDKLSDYEKLFFEEEVNKFEENHSNRNIQIKKIQKGKINSEETHVWAKNLNVDIVFLFGTGILNKNWLNTFSNRIINLHLGLSPFYKGSATLFWPFVNDELECLGATIHITSEKVDSGSILERVKINIEPQDNYYTINYKIIKKAINKYPIVVNNFLKNTIQPISQSKSITSKIYRKADFNEELLKQVLNKYGNNIAIEVVEKVKNSNRCDC